MKISTIPGKTQTVKFSANFQQQTLEQLRLYQAACEKATGGTVPFNPLVEQMLLDFMAADKDFQQYVKDSRVRSAPGSRETKPQPGSAASAEF
jgi:hypothetical protein